MALVARLASPSLKALFSALAALLLSTAASNPDGVQWQRLQPGVELAVIGARDPLYVVRIDPHRTRLQAALASESGMPRTAGAWCKTAGLSVAINLGMFQSDGRGARSSGAEGGMSRTRDTDGAGQYGIEAPAPGPEAGAHEMEYEGTDHQEVPTAAVRGKTAEGQNVWFTR